MGDGCRDVRWESMCPSPCHQCVRTDLPLAILPFPTTAAVASTHHGETPMASLQDQFMKAGLVSKGKAKQLNQDKSR